MSDYIPAGSPLYRELGLIANPFESAIPKMDPVRTLAGHASAMQILSVLEESATEGEGRPVWIEKDEGFTSGIQRYTIGELSGSTNDNDDLSLLVAYLPLELMRQGRARSALFVLSDRLSSPSLGVTLGAYVFDVLSDFDAELPEAEPVDMELLEEVRSVAQDDPAAAAEMLFGEYLETRDDPKTTNLILTESDARREPESWDDEEEPTAAEVADEPIDVTPEALDSPAESEADGETGEEEGESAPQLTPIEALREYVIARTRYDVSPVIARALTAYADHGLWAFSQELKVTKAPRKTLAALCAFASHRFKAIVLLYDRFESWSAFDFDTRQKILSSLTAIRWAAKPHAIVALAGRSEVSPELSEQFGGTWKASWGFSALSSLEAGDLRATASALVESCRIPGQELSPLVEPAVAKALESAPDDLQTQWNACVEAVKQLASGESRPSA